jgi:hypothetical protein
MALTAPTGTEIPTNVELGGTLEAVLSSPQINIPRSPQSRDAWCYAACAEMVIEFIFPGPSVSQCEVVEFVKNATCCPLPPQDQVCTDSGCQKGDVTRIFRRFDVSSSRKNNSISFNKVKTEIDAGPRRLIEAVIDWDGGGSHAVLIAGFIDASEMIYIIDPLSPPDYNGWHTHSSVRDGFGYGTWANTWLELKEKVT